MDSKTYYGEYTLKHWIELMLKQNLELPDYQRSFVWRERDIRRLIKSLNEGQFVQPVTIAHYDDGTTSKNLILDGQQRLTSILLAFLGYMPNNEKFASSENLSTGDDSTEDDDSEDEAAKKSIGWTFREILDMNQDENDRDKIIARIEASGKYDKLNDILTDKNIDDFLENTFLGFSYIIPNTTDARIAQQFFSNLFRNMNYLGMKLSPLESRRSLYYLNLDYKNYFEGKTKDDTDILCNIRIVENMQVVQIDFVRYLSILSQYTITNNTTKILVGYSAYSSRENYYADYVAYIVGLEQADRTDKFDNFKITDVFANNCWQSRFEQIERDIKSIRDKIGLDNKREAFTSWIDADYWLFGLLYWILFKGATLSYEEKLLTDISNVISTKKGEPDYAKAPNRLGNLRQRLQDSIDIYSHYAKE